VGAVSNSRQDSRSLVSAAEQLGTHSGGIVGCRALGGSGGRFGGATTEGASGDVEGVAQAPSSAASAISIGSELRMASFPFGLDTGCGGCPGGLGCARSLGRSRCGFGRVRALLSPSSLGAG
jgi:hypothetical protein